VAAAERDQPEAAERPPKRSVKPASPRQAPLPMKGGQRGYTLPSIDLLNEPGPQTIESEQELLERARLITEKLKEFAVLGTVVAVHPGPVVTTFEFKPEAGIKYSKITGMTDDLSLALKAESVRIDRMPGRATVGIEVPNRRQETIYPRQLFASEAFRASDSKLTLALGKSINGDVFIAHLDRMPHLLIAGATGAGKSVGLNCMIASLLFKATPDELRFIMIDTKMIELGVYSDIPHLLIPVVTEPKNASMALKWAVREMELRYHKLASTGVRNIAQFNALLAQEPDRTMEDPKTGESVPLAPLSYIVIVIDELADLMMVSSADVEESIMRLAQMARAVGLHLIIATQRPSVDVITGTIKANFPSRVAFRVSQRVDSRTIIDRQGAEHLLGRGDMLFLSSGAARLQRLHGGYLTESEIHRITTFIKKMAEPVYDDSVLSEGDEAMSDGLPGGEKDEMFDPAVRTVIQEGKCSITLIQRRLQLGYARAARIVDMMEREGIVSAGEGSKPREILVGPEYLEGTEIAR
jgi:S-DNA-T family DNA segregation ATPase FtsK/SpoIIIE